MIAKMEKRVFTPKTIDSTSPASAGCDESPSTPHTSHTLTQTTGNGGISTSSWNYAGTWEERDLTELSKQKIRDSCLSIKNIEIDPGVQVSISAVDKIEGEAQIVMTRGKKRHLYDFNLKLDFEITCHGSQANIDTASAETKASEVVKKSFKGSLSYGDVSPQSSLESAIKWKKLPSGMYETRVKDAIQTLHQEVQAKLKQFENEYCAM
jgi:activator of HSP90 ATPase